LVIDVNPMPAAANLITNENAQRRAPERAPSGSRSLFGMLDARLEYLRPFFTGPHYFWYMMLLVLIMH
jgi:hypothetical protein